MGLSSVIEHNKQIKQLYLQLEQNTQSAENVDDLYHVVEQVKTFNKLLDFVGLFTLFD